MATYDSSIASSYSLNQRNRPLKKLLFDFQVLHYTINSKGINRCSVDNQLKACRLITIIQREEQQQQQQPNCLVLHRLVRTGKLHIIESENAISRSTRNGMAVLSQREGPGIPPHAPFPPSS